MQKIKKLKISKAVEQFLNNLKTIMNTGECHYFVTYNIITFVAFLLNSFLCNIYNIHHFH